MTNRTRSATGLVALTVVTMLVTLLGAGTATAGVGPAAAARAAVARTPYVPPSGGHFNDPFGSRAEKERIESVILEAIRHARPKSTIRMTIFSFDRMNMAQALLDARRRGVRVKILLNDHQFTPAMRAMRDGGLSDKRRRKSFMYQCDKGCRGGGYLHTKMYLFSHTGKARHVVMVGSHNLTTNATEHQWNDLYVRTDRPKLYRAFTTLFAEMKRDRNVKPPFREFDISRKFTLYALPPNHDGPADDPMMKILNKIRCKRADVPGGRTTLRISQQILADPRSGWLTRRVVDLYAAGCDIKILHGYAGKFARKELNRSTKRGLVPARSDGYDYDGDTFLDMYSHHKYMTISGRYGSERDAQIVVTGSSNWTSLGVHGDEVIITIRGAQLVRRYNRNFDFVWRTHSKPAAYRNGVAARGRVTARMLVPQVKRGGVHWEEG